MRAVAAVIVLGTLAGTANAGGELAHTQRVIERHATAAKRGRIVAGAVATTTGVTLAIAGGYMLANAREGAFLGDFEKQIGYTTLSFGVVLAIAGPLLTFRRTELETLRDNLESEQDARHVRTVVAHRAKQARSTRRIMRGIGAGLTGLGAASTLAGVIGGDKVGDVRNDLIGMGIAVGSLGAGLVIASFIPSRWDNIEQELGPGPAPTTAGIVPVRGGVIAAIGGTF